VRKTEGFKRRFRDLENILRRNAEEERTIEVSGHVMKIYFAGSHTQKALLPGRRGTPMRR